MSDLSPGQRLGDTVLIEPIARGGYGQVWRAERTTGVGALAVKVLHAELVESAEAIGRFRREAETMASIDHPSVVKLEGFGETADGRPFIAMELLEGADLGALMELRGALPIDQILGILEAICDALDRAHALGIVHRDLKPSNVVVCGDRVVLLDFGIAKILEAAGPALTRSRMTIGTPSCMAPEQIRGAAIDARTDVYGLGALLHHLLTGVPAFSGAAVTLAYMHLHGRRPRPSAIAASTAAFDPVVARALARDPAERYPSAGAFLEAVREAAGLGAGDREGEMIGALVDISVADGALDDPDDALLDDLESIVGRVAPTFAAAGFVAVQASQTSALFVADDRAMSADAALETARAAVDMIAGRGGDPRIRVAVVMHRAAGRLCGDLVDGPLTEIFGMTAAANTSPLVIADGFTGTPG